MNQLEMDNLFFEINSLLKNLEKYKRKDQNDIKKIFDINHEFNENPFEWDQNSLYEYPIDKYKYFNQNKMFL